MLLSGFVNLGSPKNKGNFGRFFEKSNCLKKKKIYHFTSALCYKYMLRIVKGFAPRILMDGFKEMFLSVRVPRGPLGFMRLIRVGILHHSMKILCFCFLLFFRCSEDLFIGLIRIL